MDEELLAELFSMIAEGTFEDLEQFQEYIETDGIEEIYQMIPEGVFEDEDQFITYTAPLTDPFVKQLGHWKVQKYHPLHEH